MSERSLLIRRQSDSQGPREAGQAEHDIAFRQIFAETAVPYGAANHRFHERSRTGAEVGPFRFLQKRMENVHRPNSVIQGHVHILAECVDAVWYGFDQGLSGPDALFQHVTRSSVKERLLVRKVPVESSDPDTGAFSDGVSRRLAANFQNQFDSNFDQPLPVLSRISPHRAPAPFLSPISLTTP